MSESTPSGGPADDVGFVYFAQSGDFIKIGWSRDPKRRVAQLGTACPLPIALRLIVSGSKEDERHFHALFVHLRERGEWFRADPIILGHAERIRGLEVELGYFADRCKGLEDALASIAALALGMGLEDAVQRNDKTP